MEKFTYMLLVFFYEQLNQPSPALMVKHSMPWGMKEAAVQAWQ